MSEEQTISATSSIWLKVLFIELAAIFFFVSAGRFETEIFGIYISTGYDAYKLFPIVAITWVIWRWQYPSRPWPRPVFLAPLSAFFLCTVLAGASSSQPYESFPDSLEWLAYTLFYCVLIDLPWTRRYFTWAATGFLLGIFYLTGVALTEYFVAWQNEELPRVSATFDFPNALGAFSLLGLALLAYLLYCSSFITQKALVCVAIAGLLFCGVVSLSRATYLGLFVAAAVLWWYGNRSMKKWTAIALGVVLLAAMFWAPQVIQRFQNFNAEIEQKELASRFYIWPAILDQEVPEFSFFGVGLGPVIGERMANRNAAEPNPHALTEAWHPHNLYMYLFFATGPVGLFAYGWLIWCVFFVFYKNHSTQTIILQAGLLAFLVHQIFEVHLMVGNIPIVFFSLLTIADRIEQANDELH